MSEQQQMPWFENHKSKNSLVFCRWLATQRKNYMVRRLGLLSSSLVLQGRDGPSDKGNRKISNIRHSRGKWISKRCLWRKFGQRQNGTDWGLSALSFCLLNKLKLKVNCKKKVQQTIRAKAFRVHDSPNDIAVQLGLSQCFYNPNSIGPSSKSQCSARGPVVHNHTCHRLTALSRLFPFSVTNTILHPCSAILSVHCTDNRSENSALRLRKTTAFVCTLFYRGR